MFDLKARTSFRYAGKQIAAGETFQALTEKDFKVLKAVGRATEVAALRAASPAPPAVVSQESAAVAADSDEKDALRAKAAEAGIDVDMRWGVGRLRDEIAKASSGTYMRRDMRAED